MVSRDCPNRGDESLLMTYNKRPSNGSTLPLKHESDISKYLAGGEAV